MSDKKLPVIDPMWLAFETPGLSEGHGFASNLTGEKGLLASMLYRAVQDLSDNDPQIRKRAKLFFELRKHKGLETCNFGFYETCDHLNLCPKRLLTHLRDQKLL